MKTFFQYQEAARRKTLLLIAYFFLAVVLIVVSIYFAAYFVFIAAGDINSSDFSQKSLWDPAIFSIVSSLTLIVVLFGSLYKIWQLRAGGSVIARELGGRLLNPNTLDLREKRLLNVVEEMAIASGMSMPPVYLLDDEQGINAFAAGYSSGNAVIGVTAGCLDQLSREELQGVMAHEFSHILNGDMRLNIRLIGILNGILIIGLTGHFLVRSSLYSGRSRYRRNNDREGHGGIVLFGVALFVIGYIGVFFGKLIKAAVSRQREFLADASAVQFTRNSEGIGGALVKIARLSMGSSIASPHAEEASHLFFSNGLSRTFFQMLATHPPIPERLKRIDPKYRLETFQMTPAPYSDMLSSEQISGFSTSRAQSFEVTPDSVSSRVGTLDAAHIEYARGLINSFPARTLAAAHDPLGARAIVYALLLDEDRKTFASQIEYLKERESPEAVQQVYGLLGQLKQLGDSHRLPLIDLCISALRLLSQNEYQMFRTDVEHLIQADQKVSLFEFTLMRILFRHIECHFPDAVQAESKSFSGEVYGKACLVAIAALARFGSQGEKAQQEAFQQAMDFLAPGKQVDFPQGSDISLNAIDQALSVLEYSSMKTKQKIIEACVLAISADGVISVVEAELLRAIGDSLDCPIPPFLPSPS